MPRWYAGFRCVGKREHLLQQIEAVVRREDLGGVVPLVRIEKGAGRGEYYAFLAIESDTPGQPPDALDTLLRLPKLASRMAHPFELADIHRMAGPELTVHDYVRRIPYPAPDDLTEDDPLGEVPEEPSTGSEESLARTQALDRLLAWVSAVGDGTWPTFRAACQALLPEGADARRILRGLRLLGHVEASADGAVWSAAPPVLARRSTDGQPGRFVLCGRRDEELLEALRGIAEVRSDPQPDGAGPATIRVDADDEEVLREALSQHPRGAEIAIGGDVAGQLAVALPPIEGWKDTLRTLPGILPHMYEAQFFNGANFEPGPFDSQTGFYELWPLRSRNGNDDRPTFVAFYDAGRDAWLRGDWYGLRFLAYHAAGGECPVLHDPNSGDMAVLDAFRWPELYERALVLASGRLPRRRGQWLLFDGVGERVVDALVPKLRLKLERDIARA